MATIRELVKIRQDECRNVDILTPQRASEILVELSALLGNCNEEILKRDIEFNKYLMECYQKETKVNRAKIMAEVSPEYEAKQVARNVKELVIELIRSLKYFLKNKAEELEHINY